MPSVHDLVDVAESLDKRRITIVQDSCVVVRNRNAHCRACVNVCPNDALSVAGNTIKLATSRCVDCGLCITACPTEAIRALNPTASEFSQQLQESRALNNGMSVIACARMAAKQIGDPNKFTKVPCLGRISAVDVLVQVAEGATNVLLVDGCCSTCKYGFVSEAVDAAVFSANEVLTASDLDARVYRAEEFPEELLITETEGVFGSTRRGFLVDTARSARDLATSAADVAIKKELGVDAGSDIGHRLHVSDEGTLPQVFVPKHESALNALFSMVGKDPFEIESVDEKPVDGEVIDHIVNLPFFGAVDIDVNKCNACGMCAVFCPTSALKRGSGCESLSDTLTLLEFSASDCVQCGLCEDVCWKKAIALRSPIPSSELFSFEPREFHLR